METRGERRACWCLSLFILLLAVVPAGAAGEFRTVEIESLKITIDSEWAVRAAPGYLPVRFDVTNLGDARVIEIFGQGMRFSRSSRVQPGGITVRQTVRLARGDRVRLTIPVPVFADNENIWFEIREDGRTLERFNYTGLQSNTPAVNAATLIVADPATAFEKASWPRTISGPTPGGMAGAGRPLDFLLGPARLPDNWLGFTSLRAVIVGPKEWEQLTDAQKDALRTWTACGGDLIFVDGGMSPLFPGEVNFPGEAEPRARGYFFGRVHRPTSADVKAAGLPRLLSDAHTVQDADWALPANSAPGSRVIVARGFLLPIPGVDGVPARAYLSILIVFTLWIGPLNYWLLWRKKRQVLLVLTAPLISALFIMLLAGYVLAGEGLGVRGRALTFTMLDQVTKYASTRASISLYAAGMKPSGGLRFARDVAIFPIGPEGNGPNERQTLDLTDAQRFSDGVIHARSPTNLQQIGFRPARERLSFDREAGGVRVINGFGVTITALVYRDGDKVYSLAGPLLAGGKEILRTGASNARIVVPPNLLLSSRFLYLVEHQPRDSYLAVLETSPFWDPGVAGVSERGSFHLVIGWPGGQP